MCFNKQILEENGIIIILYDDNTIYAVHDSQFRRPSEGKKDGSEALTKEDFKTIVFQFPRY